MPHLSEQQKIALDHLGIQRWNLRSADQTIVNDAQPVNDLSWETLETTISHCQLCKLASSRKQTVFGTGSQHADLLIIGEAPGTSEDQQGKPFVGPAGQLLTSMLAAINLSRDEVFITNILKCRPPQNRDTEPEEVANCTPYLKRQIALLQPKAILALGRIAAHFLLNTTKPMRTLRGEVFHYGEQKIPLLVSYHPAYLLRSPAEKAKSWQDLLAVKELLR